jgi:hypothetical protein
MRHMQKQVSAPMVDTVVKCALVLGKAVGVRIAPGQAHFARWFAPWAGWPTLRHGFAPAPRRHGARQRGNRRSWKKPQAISANSTSRFWMPVVALGATSTVRLATVCPAPSSRHQRSGVAPA